MGLAAGFQVFETLPTNLNESFDARHQVKAPGYVWPARKLRGENAGSGRLSIAETEPVVVVAVVRVVVVTIGDPAVGCIVVPVAAAQQSPSASISEIRVIRGQNETDSTPV